MRPVLVALLCLVITPTVSAQSLLPLPVSSLQAHGDTPLPTPAGLVGKMQVWIIVDWSHYDDTTRKHPGRDAYWSARWHFDRWATGDQRLFTAAIAVNGTLPGKKFDENEFHVKAQDGSSGLLRALAGDAVAAVIVVDEDGVIRQLRRHSGDFRPLREEWEKLLSEGQRPLIAGPAELPPAALPALQLLKLGDARSAVALAMRRLGADGRVFATTLAEHANARLESDTAFLGSRAQPPALRFQALRRLEGLIAEFPRAPAAAAAADAMKQCVKDDAEIQAEQQAWAALGQYLAQAGRQSPRTLAAFQRQMLGAITEHFPHTNGARIAALIMTAAKVAE